MGDYDDLLGVEDPWDKLSEARGEGLDADEPITVVPSAEPDVSPVTYSPSEPPIEMAEVPESESDDQPIDLGDEDEGAEPITQVPLAEPVLAESTEDLITAAPFEIAPVEAEPTRSSAALTLLISAAESSSVPAVVSTGEPRFTAQAEVSGFSVTVPVPA